MENSIFYVVVETLFSVSLFINAALFVPQSYKLYKTKDTSSLSLAMFFGFNCIQFFIILHAFLHQDMLLLLGMLLSFITCGSVTIQIILYRYFRW